MYVCAYICACMLLSTEITVGFTVSDEFVEEADEIVYLKVSVVSGILQRSVSVGYRTVELTTEKAAKSEFGSYSSSSAIH